MTFEVYCHTSPSGKRYVGYSGDGMAQRWREHIQETMLGGDRLIHRAIRKYGADSFKHELLAVCDTDAGARVTERQWIASRGTLAPAGYNATGGGEGACVSEYLRAKMRAAWTPDMRAAKSALVSKRNPGNAYGRANLGKRRTPEQRARMSEAQRAVGFARHTQPHTAEAKAKIGDASRRMWARRRAEKEVGQ